MKKKRLKKELKQAYDMIYDDEFKIFELEDRLVEARHSAQTWKLVAKKWREKALCANNSG